MADPLTRDLRRTAGWALIAMLVVVALVGVAIDSWRLALVGLVVLLALQVAMTFDQRRHHARSAQVERTILRELRAGHVTFDKHSRRIRTWGNLGEMLREQHRRTMGVIETERLAAADRDAELDARLRALEEAASSPTPGEPASRTAVSGDGGLQ